MNRSIPSLDGLRAISILFVLFGHLVGTKYFPITREFGLAQLGVFIFFVISGYLITGLLEDERTNLGAISLKRFYLRRAYRIFPAFYIYLCAIGIAAALQLLVLNRWDMFCSATYISNFHRDESWWVAHAWSLATEEQFYLLWPPVLAFLTWRQAIAVASLIAGFAVLRFVLGRLGIPAPPFPNGLNLIASGCLLRLLRPKLHKLSLYQEILRWPIIPGAFVIGFLLSANMERLHFCVGILLGPALAVLIDSCVTREYEFLNWKWMRFIGITSYSMYIWQQPFLNRDHPAWWTAFPINALLTIAFALSSYYLIERSSLRLRERWAPAVLKPRISRV